ncbi:hypothetical protein [Aureibacillus halotolerans]|uniref:Uncharacterized protein n=1 Tax=Aureibacillus halotolerans TaxID=1508390 RepID=A0A4R6U2W9_9BACI|nr:hypothetical protein [Aureibacillus halotolerans]TDQ40778.1 hypothetical protein EV213_105124 [Aureibacillus halotolerans]
MTILLLLVAFTVSLIIAVVISLFIIQLFMKQVIGKKHSDLQDICDSEDVPARWSDRFEKKVERLKSDQQMKRVRRLANKTYIRKLNRLIAYTKHTRLVENEEVREQLLNDLKALVVEKRQSLHHNA